MRKARNLSNKLTAMLLSMTMMFGPVFESIPVYAAEAQGNAAETVQETADSATVDGSDVTAGDLLVEAEPVQASQKAALALSDSDLKAGGWNESIYAEIAGIEDADVTAVSWSGEGTGSLTGDDLEYLVRKSGTGVRIDIPGLKAGTYTLTVKVGEATTLTKAGIVVSAYDRSGFAHFGYNDGVGAYNDDGTLKSDAIVLYVTDANKNSVQLTYGGKTVTGIGNILNSVGQESGNTGLASNGGAANTNQGIIKDLALAGKPLVVRFIGTVSNSGLYEMGTFNANSTCKIVGLTAYSSTDQGGTAGDNGHMARIQSGKDITLEGIGYDATIDGWGFHFICQSSNPELGKSFEVRNLTFINTPEDAVGMEGQQTNKNASSQINASVERCWIHHNEYYCPSISSPAESDKSEGDGSVDFKRGQYFTCSYNYFEGCHKTNLVGSADYSLQFNLSYHHNWWYMCKARGPLTRRANVHMYNNIWDMQTDYAENTRADAYIFSEYNLFYACKSPQAVEAGAIKSYNDSISSVIWNKGSAGTVVTEKTATVANNCGYSYGKIDYSKFDTTESQSYIPSNNYTLQTDFTQLRKVIVAETGTMDQNPKTAAEVTASEYSMVQKMGVTPVDIDLAQEYTTLPGKDGKVSKTTFAFTVGGAMDITVEYADATKAGVLVNEAGENLLEGSGTATDLPAGTYMIQPVNFQPGTYKDSNSVVTWKEFTISSLKIAAHNPNAHYHKWNAGVMTQAPKCTTPGVMTYTCIADGCPDGPATRTEAIAALGHTWGAWVVTKEATEEENGEKTRTCSVCNATETAAIPAGSSGTGGESGGESGGGSTVAGDYVLTFDADKKVKVDAENFYTLTGSITTGTAVKVNGTDYTAYLKMDSKGTVSFSCNDGASLKLVFGDSNGKKVKVGGTEYTIGTDGIVTVEELKAGSYVVAKSSGESHLYYAAVSNSAANTYQVTVDYNYGAEDADAEDEPDAKELTVTEGTTYAILLNLVKSSMTRAGYQLAGLYTDEACTQAVSSTWTATNDITFYAGWTKDEVPEEKFYTLVFNTNGGLAVPSVQISENDFSYVLTQTTTKDGYAFAGWYDKATGGNKVEKIDGTQLTGPVAVYAYWNAQENTVLSLDCSTDLTSALDSSNNIKAKTVVNGFTIYALPGGVGTAGNESPKYYMSYSTSGKYLGTNGVLLTDTSITGNEDGLLKAIEFTTTGAGTLTVDLSRSANSGSTVFTVATKVGGVLTPIENGTVTLATGSTGKVTKTFALPGANTYYMYASGEKGIRYYSMKVTEPQYTVMFQLGTGTMTEGLTGIIKKVGETVPLTGTVAPDPGYAFKGWSMDGTTLLTGDSYTVKAEDAVNGTIIIKALYDEKQYTVKFEANGGTLPDGFAASVSAKRIRDELQLKACTPVDGKRFVAWVIGEGDSKKSYTDSYTVDDSDANESGIITLKAEYEDIPIYTVKFQANGGLVEIEDQNIREGGLVTKPDDPKKDKNKFEGWFADEALSVPYNFETAVTGNITLFAKWTPDETVSVVTYTVTFDSQGGSAVAAAIVEENGKCSKPADPTRDGYSFVGWFVDVQGKMQYDFNAEVKANITLYAKWALKDSGKGSHDGSGQDDKVNLEETAKSTQEKPIYEGEMVKGQKDTLGAGNWTSDNPKVVSVSKKTGAVTAKSAGSATLTDASTNATYNITVYEPALSEKKLTLLVGTESQKIKLLGTGNMPVSWISSNPAVATVAEESDDDGSAAVITATGKGSVKIQAYVGGKAYTVSVTVKDTAPSVKLKDEAEITLNVRQTYSLKFENGFKASGATWTDGTNEFEKDGKGNALADEIISISKSGKVTALKEGETTIYGTDKNGLKVIVEVKVKAIPTKTVIYLNVGGKTSLAHTYAKKGEIEWSADDDSIVTLTNTEKAKVGIQGNVVGETVLTCTCNDVTYETVVYVENPALTATDGLVQTNPAAFNYTLTMNKGDTFDIEQLGVEQKVVFKSSKKKVAFVDEYGVISARTKGKTVISAKVNGKAVKISLTVND